MHVTLVYVKVKPEHIDDFIKATEANHIASLQEAGNLRFDVIQEESDPSCFVLYEAYKSDADARAHKDTAHYLTWRETVADWMAEPRKGVTHTGLFL